MTPEDRRHATAIDHYWDGLALTGNPPEKSGLERETAVQIDWLWALSSPPVAERARELVWRRLQLRDAESTADVSLVGTRLDAASAPSAPANGRISPLSPAVDRAAWRRGVVGRFATAALLILVLLTGLFVMGPLRLPRPADLLVAVSDPATTSIGTEPLAEFLWLATGGPNSLLGEPIQPAIDAAGNLWVPDTAHTHNRFLIFTPDGTFLETWGAPGHGEGEFAFSCSGVGLGGIAFDTAGNVYVADAGNQRVQKFGPDRAFVSSWGSAGTADGQFLCPAAIAVDGQDRVYVADHGRGAVKVFTGDGVWLATWSGLTAPIGIAVVADDSLWVADSDGGVVQFSAEGERLTAWDASAVGDAAVNDPTGIAVDAEGRVYVTDAGANRVQVFAPEGTVLGGWGERGEAAGQFQEPRGIALDGQGAVYVADFYGERVQKFRLLPPLTPSG
jgi:DNA-binding beta-propeller fold protein YncE